MKLENCAILVIFSVVSAVLGGDAKGKLIVISEPSEANVWINNRLSGQTPLLNLPLDPGIYEIRIEDPLRRTSTVREIDILADSTAVLNVTLQRQDFGTIHVESNPPGADVYLLTKVKINGKTPATDDQIVPGAYSLQVVPPNKRYTSSTESIVITGNETSTKEITLRKQPLISGKGWLRIGLGTISLGSFIVSTIAQSKHNTSLANTGLIVGGACLLGVEIVAFF